MTPQPLYMSHEELMALKKSIENIETAVCGNERLGVTGLVKRVDSIERWKRKTSLRIAFVSGGFIAIWQMIKATIEWLQPHNK